MTTPVYELLDRLADRIGAHNQQAREDSRAIVGSLQVTTNGTAVAEPKLQDNVINLSAGDHGGMKLTKAGTIVVGSGDCNVTRQVVIDGGLIVLRGLRFVARAADDDRNNAAALVTVSATSKVIFVDCVFRKADKDFGVFMTVASGGRVNLLGCSFIGGASATNAISNAGPAANVQQAFGANTSGAAHANVATTSEIT